MNENKKKIEENSTTLPNIDYKKDKEELVNTYNKAIMERDRNAEIATRCLGAIELLNKYQPNEE